MRTTKVREHIRNLAPKVIDEITVEEINWKCGPWVIHEASDVRNLPFGVAQELHKHLQEVFK